jgi:membrane-associated protease RseP (regulator of RpoE activity)
MNNLESIAIILSFIFLIWLLERNKFKREGILFLRRTKRGLNTIDRTARKYERFFKIMGDVGIILGFGLIGVYYLSRIKKGFSITVSLFTLLFIFYLTKLYMGSLEGIIAVLGGSVGLIILLLTNGAYNILTQPGAAPTITPVIPGVKIPGAAFYVPLWHGLIALFVVVVVHEFSHALLARAERIKVNSLGYGFLAILPLAFAEPDEKELKKAESIKKSRIFAIGSASNILFGVAVAVILFSFISPVLHVNALVYAPLNHTEFNISEPFPAQSYNMTGFILEVDGIKISDVDTFSEIMSNKKPSDYVTIKTTKGTYNIKLTENPSNKTKAYLGIGFSSDMGIVKVLKEKYRKNEIEANALNFIIEVLSFIILLNIGIGMANFMPFKPLDGGLLLEEILRNLNIKNWKRFYNFFATLTLGLLILNLSPFLIRLGSYLF